MTDCQRFAPMIGSRPGELGDDDTRDLSQHLAGCAACRARQADLESLSGMLADALLAEAAGRDFASFSDGVLARLPGGRARAGVLARLLGWARHHRVLATASAVAPTLAALGLIVYLTGHHGPAAAEVEVSSEEHATMVLETSDGPVVLFGDSEPEGS